MCQICDADAELIFEEIIPDHYLYVAKRDSEFWPRDYYGLCVSDHPILIFSKYNLEDDPEDYFSFDAAMVPMDGYKFVSCCEKAGFDEIKHSFNPVKWFLNLVKEKLNEHNNNIR